MVKTETYAIHPTAFIDQPVATPHQPRYAQQLFDFGMIATGNHNFEKFAALCNAPGGSQGAVAGAGSIQRSALFRPQMAAAPHRVANLVTPAMTAENHMLPPPVRVLFGQFALSFKAPKNSPENG